MNSEIFGIENFNLISDDNYYYVFRALNRDDQREIDEGVTTEDGKVRRIITNKQRYPENDRYASSSEISLAEVWDHTKSVSFYRGTSCISLSSNANVSIDYGSKYGHRFLMIRIPKQGNTKVYNAGQYMFDELNKMLDEKLKELPEDSEILSLIRDIESKTTRGEVREIIRDRFEGYRTGGKFTSKASLASRELTLINRFGIRQAFSEEQELEYSKLMGKLTLMEIYGLVPRELIDKINITSLTGTIGSEFSNREFVHYGEITSDEFIPISRINLDMFALLQTASDQGVDKERIRQIEARLIDYTNRGFELVSRDGRLYYSNGSEEIDLNLDESSILINEDSLLDKADTSIEDSFERTNGSISFLRAKTASQFVHNLSIAQRKTIELTSVLKSIIGNEELVPVIDEIAKKGIAINDRIITRKNGKGMQISESVNIDINSGERKQFTDEEQEKIYERIKGLSSEELDLVISGNDEGKRIELEIYNSSLDRDTVDETKTREERLNRYYAETIVDTLDINDIYRRATKDKSLNPKERERIVSKLETADCRRLVNAFIKAGISEAEVSGYIINILAANGYKGYTLEELSRLDNLDEIISINVGNKSLRGHVFPAVMEELREIRDDDNFIDGTEMFLKDYQQESVDNVDTLFADGKRFAGVVLPTGAGKSFVAMAEMLKNKNGNILYVAPQLEILNQVKRHILKNIVGVEVLSSHEIERLKEEQHVEKEKELKLPEGKILPSQSDEYIKTVFPHLKMFCYQGLADLSKENLTEDLIEEADFEQRELREILKNADSDLIIFDELHRSGANKWKGIVKQLIDTNKNANILGITATPIRDVDHVDMMRELAKMVGTYSEEELTRKRYLAYEMYLVDAIQRGLVVEPQIVSFDFMLRDTAEYQEILKMIDNEKDPNKKDHLIKIREEIDELLKGEIDPSEHVKGKVSEKESEEIGKIISETIKKKDGRYIVFLPQHPHSDGLTETEYFEQQEERIRKIVEKIDPEPEISRLSSADSKADNQRAISDFENSNSKHLKIILAINKLNEGVHVEGINGEMMFRKIGNGSSILYFQQLGRVIYALDPNNPVDENDIPIVYDVFNNYLIQHLNRAVNQSTPKSDLQKLQEIIEWMDKHGYEPDINSEDLKEARKAITLKNLQTKYKKYIDGINNPRLSKSDIFEIEQIMELAYSIDLFNKDMGTRIIPPGERDISEVQLFKVTAVQKRFLELYKEVSGVVGYRSAIDKKDSTNRLETIMNVLDALRVNDIVVDNSLIKYKDTLKDVLERLPKEIKEKVKDELSSYNEDYPLGEEYNFIKSAFRDPDEWKFFRNSDVRMLYACGIMESVDEEYFSKHWTPCAMMDVLSDDFVILGHNSLKFLNVKTGTYFDENGKYYDQDFIEARKTAEERRKEENNKVRRRKIEKNISIIRIIYETLPEGYSMANESLEELNSFVNIDLIDRARDVTRERDDYDGFDDIPTGFQYQKQVLKIREFLEEFKEDFPLEKEQIIEFKRMGILPLRINSEGIDEDTGLPRESFGGGLNNLGKRIRDEKGIKRLNHAIFIFKLVTDELGMCFVNESLDEIPDTNFRTVTANYHLKGNIRQYRLNNSYRPRRELEIARRYIEENRDKFSEKDIIELKRIGVLPLVLDENGVDKETNLPRSYYEFVCVDRYSFDRNGYYCKKQEDGTYVNTGLKYSPRGFRQDGTHVITGKVRDIRGFYIDGYTFLPGGQKSKVDENGFDINGEYCVKNSRGEYVSTGEIFHEGYNAYGLDEKGRNKDGKLDPYVRVANEILINGIIHGKINTIMEKYKIKDRKNLRAIIYEATEKCPALKKLYEDTTKKYSEKIIEFREKYKELKQHEAENAEEIEKLKKQIGVLKRKLKDLNPMSDIDK